MKLRKTVLFLVIVQIFVCGYSYAQTVSSLRINPTNWWVGMKNPEVQLLIHGKNIAEHSVTMDAYKGVKLKKVHKVENPNYVFVDLLIDSKTKPGQIVFRAQTEEGAIRQSFDLLPRSSYQPQGLSPADFIYLLMPDRFANGDESNDAFPEMADPIADRNNPFARHGGDLQGVQQHLDYFTDLGVTALWLNPVIENDQAQTNENGTMRSAYHGYGFTDHYQVDRRLGGNEAYKNLINEAHKKGLKVIQDAVYNHVGINHWILKDLPMKDWLNQWDTFTQTSFKEPAILDPNASEYDRKVMTNGWFMSFLPDLNQKNPFVANFLIQHALWTVEYFGIDAWRIDTYMYNDMDFMNRCNDALLAEYPTLLLFGESIATPVANQAAFVRNNLKLPFTCNLQSTIDYQLFVAIKTGLNQAYGWHDGVNRIYGTLAQDYLYQNPELLVTYLDNHDEDRFLSVIGENHAKYKMGLTWLMTLRGIPQIYYGTELAVKNFKNPSDAEVRKDFVGGWKTDVQNKFNASDRTPLEQETYDFVKKLATIRKNSEAITQGKFKQFAPFQEGVYVYFRYTDKQRVMVISNTSTQTQKISMSRFQEIVKGANKAKNLLTGELVDLEGITVEPTGFLLLEIQN